MIVRSQEKRISPFPLGGEDIIETLMSIEAQIMEHDHRIRASLFLEIHRRFEIGYHRISIEECLTDIVPEVSCSMHGEELMLLHIAGDIDSEFFCP